MFIGEASCEQIDFPEYHRDATLWRKKEQAPEFGACEVSDGDSE
jgi:hypothetical protein